MESIFTDGTAYAFPFRIEDPKGEIYACPGMSLRDYFAGQALAGLAASEMPAAVAAKGGFQANEVAATFAYLMADSMLDEREEVRDDAPPKATALEARAATLLREGADLMSVEVDALKSGISINGETKPSPEDAHTVATIAELEAWIARAGKLDAEIAANEREAS